MNVAILGVRGVPSRYGGFETSAEETAIRMAQLGHNVTVYCRGYANMPTPDEYKGVKLVYLPTIALKSLDTIVNSIVSGFHVAFINRGCEVVHMYNAASAMGGLLVKLSGKKLVMTLDGIEWERENWGVTARLMWKFLTWLAVKISDRAVCDSRVVGDFFEKRYKVKLDYIPYGAKVVDRDLPLDRALQLDEKNYFIFVGRFVKEKRVDALIKAYIQISTDMPLVLIGGNDNDPEYVDYLKSIAGEGVRFIGYRYGAEYESLLVNARVYVSASMLEGTSPSLLASMGAGVCCIVNGIEENRETGGDAVMYFDGSIEGLAAGLELLAKDDDVVREYAEKGFNRVRTCYDWDVVTEKYLDCYK